VLLEEDGRCVLSGLLPDQCGCRDHRNSDPDDRVTADYAFIVTDTTMARYYGRCALEIAHRIQPGDEMSMAVQYDNPNVQIGWICADCATGSED
jgi:hypothetical protein